MAYSEESQLLLGDMQLGSGFNTDKYIEDAARDMNAKLGWIYQLPLHRTDDPEPYTGEEWKSLPGHEVLTLQQISNRLASGKLILAMAVGQEGSTVHAYGYHLLKGAEADLMCIANGDVDLSAVRLDGSVTDLPSAASRTPAMIVHDDESLSLGFENVVLRGVPWYTRPGQNN